MKYLVGFLIVIIFILTWFVFYFVGKQSVLPIVTKNPAVVLSPTINKKPDVEDKKSEVVVTKTVTVIPSVVPTNTPIVTQSVKPTITPIITLIEINPNILKLLPTIAPKPTTKYKVLFTPTPIKIYFPKW